MKAQIVLARLVDDCRVVKPGQPDLGIAPTIESFANPVAMLWLRRGGDADILKARSYAASEGYSVFIYPTSERDPLGRAKKDVSRA